ncbi:helix-turn-helix transcriptional regulator [Aeromicrobium alkaliterrae]
MTDDALGRYLKACRARTSPEDAEVRSYGPRRVPGLRREEVAMLAGVSVDYYTRLEQGRERHPSASVLDALARAFALSDDEREHVFRLADTAAPTRVSRARTTADPALLELLDDWPMNPAIVITRVLDVLAVNALARELFGGLEVGQNLAERMFLHPDAHDLYPDWPAVAESTAANLRLAEGFAPDDARLREVVGHLSETSPEFRRLWERGEVRGKTSEAKRFSHPSVGAIDLTYQAFDVRTSPDQQLVVYRAAPGSASADALRLLGTVAATQREHGARTADAP